MIASDDIIPVVDLGLRDDPNGDERYDLPEEEGDLVIDMQLNVVEQKIEQAEGLYLKDYKDSKSFADSIISQRIESLIQLFLVQQRQWQHAIYSTKNKIEHLGVFEDANPQEKKRWYIALEQPRLAPSRTSGFQLRF